MNPPTERDVKVERVLTQLRQTLLALSLKQPHKYPLTRCRDLLTELDRYDLDHPEAVPDFRLPPTP